MVRFRFVHAMCVTLLLGLAACQAAPVAAPTAASVPTTAPSTAAPPTAAAPATSAPTTAPTVAPSTAVPATAVSTATLPAATATPIPTAEPPTTFSSDKFKVPMTFTFGPDWFVEDDYPELVTLSRKQEGLGVSFNIVNDARLIDPADGHRVPFPQDFAAWLAADRDFAVGEQRRVTVAGQDGLQIDATPTWRSSIGGKKSFLVVNGAVTWNLVPSPEKWRFIMLDNVDGQRVLVLMIAPAGKFDAAMLQARVILDNAMLGRPAKVLAEWKIANPEDFAFGFDTVWVPSRRTPNVTTRIDPASNKVVATIPTGIFNHAALVVGDAVWTTGERNDMARIDPATNSVSAKVPGGHTYVAYGFGAIWSTTNTDAVDRIDPGSAKVIATIPLGGSVVDNNPTVLVTASAVWVDHEDTEELIKIDPKTNTVVAKKPYKQLIAEAQAQTSVPPGKGTSFLWLGLYEGLLRVDPITFRGVAFLPLKPEQEGGRQPAVGDNSVWLAGANQIMRVNVATNQIDATYITHPGAWAIGLGFGSVWVAYQEYALVQRLDIAP